MVERWSISVPDDIAAEVMAQMDYSSNRSEWVVDAIERKLAGETGGGNIDAAALVDDVDGLKPTDREGAVAIVEYIAANSVVAKQQLLENVFPDAPGNRSSPANWYKQIVPALEAAGVLKRDAQGKIWLADDVEVI